MVAREYTFTPTPFSCIPSPGKLQIVPVSADGDISPLVEPGDRLGQDIPDTVVAIATKQDHRGEFSTLRDPLTLYDIYHNVDSLLRIARLIVVVG